MVDKIRRDQIAPHTALTAVTSPPTDATVEIQFTDGTIRRVQLQHLPAAAGSAAQWRTGAGAPSNGLGANGDFYLNSTNGDYYGPKASGAWGSVVGNLKGLPGNNWIIGTTAPASGTGVNGDLFLNIATGDVYGPKASGAWGAIAGSLRGPAGAAGPKGLNPRGTYNSGVSYAAYDLVSYNYMVAYAKQATSGNPPTDAVYWEVLFDGAQAVADALASTPRAEASDGTVVVATMKKLRAGSGVTILPDGADPERAIIAASGGGAGATDLSVSTTATTVTVLSNTGADAVLPAATGLAAGVMSAGDKSKLDAVPGTPGVVFDVQVTAASGTPAAFVFALKNEMIGNAHGFWSAVQADGGDIRVYQDQARTIRLPIHIAQFDRAAKTCTIFVRLTNAIALNGTFTVLCGTGDGAATQPAVDQPYGRNAVWAGWDLVTQDFTTDVTGNGALTATGTALPTITPSGVYGLPRIAFNGTNQTVQTVDARARRSAVTIMAFAKPVSGAQGLVGYDDDLVSVDFVGAVMRRAKFATTSAQHNAAFSWPANTWRHVAVRHDMSAPANQPVLYQDGASLGAMTQQAAGAGVRSTAASVISIGAWGTNGAAPFNGEIADFRQFNGLLSDAYIAAIFANMTAPGAFAAAGAAASLNSVIATQAVAEAGTANDALMTPKGTKQQIDARIASKATAEAGADNEKLMTALRVRDALIARNAATLCVNVLDHCAASGTSDDDLGLAAALTKAKTSGIKALYFPRERPDGSPAIYRIGNANGHNVGGMHIFGDPRQTQIEQIGAKLFNIDASDTIICGFKAGNCSGQTASGHHFLNFATQDRPIERVVVENIDAGEITGPYCFIKDDATGQKGGGFTSIADGGSGTLTITFAAPHGLTNGQLAIVNRSSGAAYAVGRYPIVPGSATTNTIKVQGTFIGTAAGTVIGANSLIDIVIDNCKIYSSKSIAIDIADGFAFFYVTSRVVTDQTRNPGNPNYSHARFRRGEGLVIGLTCQGRGLGGSPSPLAHGIELMSGAAMDLSECRLDGIGGIGVKCTQVVGSYFSRITTSDCFEGGLHLEDCFNINCQTSSFFGSSGKIGAPAGKHNITIKGGYDIRIGGGLNHKATGSGVGMVASATNPVAVTIHDMHFRGNERHNYEASGNDYNLVTDCTLAPAGISYGISGTGFTRAGIHYTDGAGVALGYTLYNTTGTWSTTEGNAFLPVASLRAGGSGAALAPLHGVSPFGTAAIPLNAIAAHAAFVLQNAAQQYGLQITINSSTGVVSFQSGNHTGAAAAYGIALNPSGGPVVVGAADGLVGLYGEAPAPRASSTGQTAGFTANTGTSVTEASTFTGGLGSKAYTIGDLVKHLKTLGALHSS